VIAGDGEHHGVVVLVRFIELTVIEVTLPIEIDYVSKVVIEGGSRIFSRGCGNLIIHCVGDCLLDVVTMDPARVTYRVKNECPRICRRFCLVGKENVQAKIQILEVSSWRWDESGILLGEG
jgi:hypothetical protein